ncbi:MAG: histidine kinase [Rikenellaceae bacterium]|jgi:signal transduction histidine kinase|nr:histidine kinase [Rikenellaceae bacterium]
MVLKILLIVSIILQLFAAGIAIRQVRRTKYNSSWILLSIALTLMTFQRLVDFLQIILSGRFEISPLVGVWIGIVTSLCFAAGIYLVDKVLNYIDHIEKRRRSYEKRILNAIIRTEERERQRYSREIHDGLGPLISSIKLSVSALDKITADPRQRALIDNTNLVIEEAVRCLREISNNMNPHVLTNFGLLRAVTNFVNKLAPFSKVKFDLTSNLKETRFDANAEAVFYRVICELINNALKHAEATRIDLDITATGDEIAVTFTDDGKGFNPTETIDGPGGGMGLSNIRSRISSIKGEIEFDSRPGNGTAIRIRANTKQM